MSARPIAFLNARLVDPSRETESRGGLLVQDGVIAVTCEFCNTKYVFTPAEVEAVEQG